MPYILVDKSENWPSEWGGLEHIWFDPANPKAPKFTRQWDTKKEKWVQYNVRAHISGNKLRIEYHEDDNQDNPDLAEYEVYYGVHTLTIENGATHGTSDWHERGEPKQCKGPGWRLEAISGGAKNRRRGAILAIQRGEQGIFRQQLLAMDECCAVTGERCESVLEAAHIVPAHKGGYEVPSNGILLRADIHRLFDSNPPKFEICPEDRQVVPVNGFRYGSVLEDVRIPEEVHERIAQALEMRSKLFGAK